MQGLKELIELCTNSVEIRVNEHKDLHQTASEYLEDYDILPTELPEDVRKVMIKKNTVVYLQAYPLSSISSYSAYHFDVDECISQMINQIKKDRNEIDVS
jgi:hypothetical protein